MEVLKYERTKAPQLMQLPNIATSLKPYRLARADTNGPEKMDNLIIATAVSSSADCGLFALTFR